MNKPRVQETLCFAGIFLVVHFVTSLFFEHAPLRDAAPASSGSEVAAELLIQSVITAALAAPAYFVLTSWYRRFGLEAKRFRRRGREMREEILRIVARECGLDEVPSPSRSLAVSMRIRLT